MAIRYLSTSLARGWLSQKLSLENYLEQRGRRSTKVPKKTAPWGKRKKEQAEDVCSSYVRLFDSFKSASRNSGYYLKGKKLKHGKFFCEVSNWFLISDKVYTARYQCRTNVPIISYVSAVILLFSWYVIKIYIAQEIIIVAKSVVIARRWLRVQLLALDAVSFPINNLWQNLWRQFNNFRGN